MAKTKAKALTAEDRLAEALVPESEQPYEVPENWVWTRIKSLSQLHRGVSYPKDAAHTNKELNDFLVMRGGNINEGSINFDDNIYVDISLIKPNQLLQRDDVVIVSSTGSTKVIGKAGIVDDNYSDVAFGAFLTLVRPNDGIIKRLVSLFFQTESYRNVIRSLAKGVNINNIKNDYIENIVFPLPPLAEQRRVVARIESLFEKLDRAKELAQSALDSFETRKASILHKAFTGELTAKWREENGVGIESWKEKPLKSIAKLRSGYAFNSKEFTATGYQVIRMGNLYNGVLDITRAPVFMDKNSIDDVIREKFSAKQGDILLTLTGTKYKRDYGYAVLIEEDKGFLVNQRILVITPVDVEQNFILHYLRSDLFRDVFFSNETGGVNQGNVSSTFVGNIHILLPTLAEQQKIVRILDSLLEKEQRAHELCDVIDKIDLMKKAILARAFRCELGTNDPSEESAVELLKEVLQ